MGNLPDSFTFQKYFGNFSNLVKIIFWEILQNHIMCHFTLISHDFFLNVHVSPCKWCKAKLSGVVILVAEMGTVAHEPMVTMLSLFQIKCLHT